MWVCLRRRRRESSLYGSRHRAANGHGPSLLRQKSLSIGDFRGFGKGSKLTFALTAPSLGRVILSKVCIC